MYDWTQDGDYNGSPLPLEGKDRYIELLARFPEAFLERVFSCAVALPGFNVSLLYRGEVYICDFLEDRLVFEIQNPTGEISLFRSELAMASYEAWYKNYKDFLELHRAFALVRVKDSKAAKYLATHKLGQHIDFSLKTSSAELLFASTGGVFARLKVKSYAHDFDKDISVYYDVYSMWWDIFMSPNATAHVA